MVNSEIWLNILKSSPHPIAVFSISRKSDSLFFVNKAYCDLLGVQESEIDKKSVADLFLSKSIHVKDDFIPGLTTSFRQVFKSGQAEKITNVQLDIHSPDSAPATFYIDLEHTPIIESGVVKYVSQSLIRQKQVSGLSSQSADKNSEQLIRAEMIETILQNLPIGIAVNRIDNGEATLVNRQFSATYGWSEQDLVDVKSFFDKVYPDPLYREKILRRVMEDINSGEESRMEWDNIEVTTFTGEKRLINAKNIPLFDQNLMISTVVDITLQARQADEIRKAKVNQETLINSSEDLIWSVDTDKKIITANKAFFSNLKHATGRDLKEGDFVQDNIYGDEVNEKWKEYYNRALGGESYTVKEQYFSHLRKGIEYLVVSFNPMRNEEGEIFGAACYAKDITNDAIALIALQKARNEIHKIMDSSLDVICTIDANGCFASVSAAAVKIWGYTPEELVGRRYMELVYDEDIGLTIEASRDIMGGTEMTNFENRYVRKDGSLVTMVWSARWDDTDQIMYCIAKDATEREKVLQRIKENESKLLAAQKIAKVGYWQSFPDSKGLYWSDEVYNIWGLDKNTFQLDYDSYFETIHPDDRTEFLISREQALSSGVQHDVEHRIILPEGSIKWVHALGNLIKDDLGGIMIFEGTVQDITKDKLALEKLLVSEARHRGIFESQTNYMIRTDMAGNYSFVNNKFLQDFGWLYENKEILGQNCLSSILVYHHERVADTVAKCFAELNKVFQVFIDKPRKDGKGVVSTLWDFICLTDAKGKPSEIQCVGIDVSEWKKTQEELEESNLRYEYVTRATSDAIWDWDLRTDEVYYGGSFQTLFGYSVENIEKNSMLWEDHVHPDDLSRVLETIEAVIKGYLETLTLEYRFEKSDGTYAFIQDQGILIKDKYGTPIKMVGAMQDITNRKNIELELLQFKKIIDNSKDGIAIVDLEGKITYINPAFSDTIGFDPLIHNHPESVYDNRQLVGQVFDTLLSGKYWKGDVEIKTQAGELISYYLSGGPVFDEEGKLKAVYGIHTDITERKQAEQNIRKAYYERNTILESIGDGFFAVDKSWTINYWNREAEKLLGVTKKQALGNNLWDVFDHMAKSTSYSKYLEAIDTNQVIHFVDYYPSLHKWYEVSAYPSVDGLSVFFKDITERKIYDIQVRELNEVLRTKVKELAVSNRELEQFAYVASHDLQEPLRMISSFLTQLQRKYDDQLDAKAHQYIHFAVDGAKRMRQIILDLLDFSRVGRGDSEKELVNLNEVINEILILFRKNIEDTKALFVISDLPSINVPNASIRQLLQNLVSNAMKYQSPENSPLIEIGFTEKPDYWEFWVKDNGIGISSDYFEKIFIIFQRLHTKDQYSGTGMGLAICRKIVENIGGKLWVESEEEKGSTFYFTIPKTTISVSEV